MVTQGNVKFFKWWYVKDISNYQKLFEENTAALTAMTMDEEIIQKIVPLHTSEDGIVVANLGPEKGDFYLTPNQMVSKEDSLKDFWLADTLTGKRDTSFILGTITAMESGKAVTIPEGGEIIRIYGKPINEGQSGATIVTRSIDLIVPVGSGNYIVREKDQKDCIFVSDRETNEHEINVLIKRLG